MKAPVSVTFSGTPDEVRAQARALGEGTDDGVVLAAVREVVMSWRSGIGGSDEAMTAIGTLVDDHARRP